jgi:pimeloyl-ACP methyl ester carboxylesterase
MTFVPPGPPSGPSSADPGSVHVTAHPGAEPVVVLVHGAMDRSTSFGRVARHLADLAVVRYDRRGYGRSRRLGPTDLAGHVADLAAVVADRPAVLVGHSVGGVIALASVGHLGAVRGVVAYEAPMPWASWWPSGTGARAEGAEPPADAAERFMRHMVGDRVWSRLPASTRAARRAEGPALRADLDLVAGGPPYDLAGVTVPVLALAGSDTTWWHRRGAEELAAATSHGRFALIEGAAHGAHLSHPHALAARIRAFRAGLERGPAAAPAGWAPT